MRKMATGSESDILDEKTPPVAPRGDLLKLGAVAVASAVLGGIAAAWWYRKTIQKLHETGENSSNPHFGIDSDHPFGEATDEP